MVTKLRLLFTITIAFLSFYGSAQSGYWKKENTRFDANKDFSERFNIKNGTVFSLEEKSFKEELKSISTSGKNSKIVHFPDETGKLIAFQITEAPVMSPELSAKYPTIKSYKGFGIQNRSERIRFSVSDAGVESMIVNTNGSGNVYMQKSAQGKYAVYRREKDRPLDNDFICATTTLVEKSIGNGTTLKPVDGQVLRKYRLAVSATGEYTTYHGGTVNGALAAINATVTRINEVYETDLGITLELVGNNELVIYTNATTDPYSSNLNTQVQTTLNNVIGAANYDIGHLFQKGVNGGDAGFVGSVCVNNRKGSAYSSAVDPVGDLYDIDFVAHEMGHQFGANHTWSFESEGTLVQAEPGSGTTIMGYAGISGQNNVATHGDDYFHYLSIVQISDYVETASCGEIIGIVNNPPVVTTPGDFVIPKSTAFFLEGNATDADAADVLSYAWEQVDDGVVTFMNFGPTNPSGANFRSQKPTSDPRRYFPKIENVLQGNLTQSNPSISSTWETSSDIEREMNFAFTVRDNGLGGGQVVSDLVKVSVVNNSGPFKVLSQSSNANLPSGNILDVNWDVANTEKAPVNAKSVDILLSIDSGRTYPIVLAQDVPNDGSHKVVIPGSPTSQARLMVKGHDNVFFAVNAANFTIEPSEIVLNFTDLDYGVCQGDDLVVPFIFETYLGFNEEATFSVVAPPVGLGVSFSPSTAVISNSPIDLTFTNTLSVPEGTYNITVLATTATRSKTVDLQLHVYDNNFTDILLVSPVSGEQDVSKNVTLEWQADPTYTDYDVQVATDAAFSSIIQTENVVSNTYLPSNLANETTYYWRVKPKNDCGEGTYSSAFSFTTIQFNCANEAADNLPIVISATGTPVITSKITFYEDLILADLNVNLQIDHSFLADLVVSLTSPTGTTVVLTSSSCGGLSNINATFDDSANAFICGGSPAISGTVKPLGSLNSFNGESILGEWTLEIVDNAPSDGGSLKAFSLDMCVEGQFRPDADNDGIFDDGDDLCLGTPEGDEVNSSGCTVYRFQKNNFNVTAQSESCRNNNDGVMTVTATIPLDYVINISGQSLNITENFANTFTLPDLGSGVYNICINATDGAIVYEAYCFDVNITEPLPISVTSKTSADGKAVTLSLQGNSFYFIELNGAVIQTEESTITLDLKTGRNSLKVSTGLPCQGVYEEYILLSDQPVVYPNPFTETVRIFLSSGMEDMNVSIYGSNGQLLQSHRYRVDSTELELNFSTLPSGIYYLKFEGANIKATTKLIKK